MTATAAFVREHLRAPFTLGLLVAIPVVFVVAAAGVLSDFADALGGSLASESAAGLSAGWSAAFIAGTLGFFQAASSRGADRRLALAGLGPVRVAGARIGASLGLAVVASAAGLIALALRSGVEHPFHAAAAVLAFALIYLAVGVLVGSVISGQLEGSLTVVLVFLLDVFSGPGMSEDSGVSPLSISRKAADLLIAAAAGEQSPGGDWVELGLIVAAALALSFAAFVWSARSRA